MRYTGTWYGALLAVTPKFRNQSVYIALARLALRGHITTIVDDISFVVPYDEFCERTSRLRNPALGQIRCCTVVGFIVMTAQGVPCTRITCTCSITRLAMLSYLFCHLDLCLFRRADLMVMRQGFAGGIPIKRDHSVSQTLTARSFHA